MLELMNIPLNIKHNRKCKKTNQAELSNIIKKTSPVMVWAPAEHGCESINTEATPLDSLPWTKKTRQTKDNLKRRH